MTEEEEVATIPLLEERVDVSTREVESGHVRVQVTVDERQESIAAELSRDEIEVKRVAKNELLSELPGVRLEGETTIIPVVEEQVVIEKRLVLVEEIHVSRRSATETQQIPVTLRSEVAHVERDGEATGEISKRQPQWEPCDPQ